MRQLEMALQDCTYAIDNGRNDYWVPFNYRGFVNYLLNSDQDAIDDWTRAAQQRSQPLAKAESLENLGLVYLRQREWQLALDNAESVNELWSESPWNCLFRGIAAQELGDMTVAEDALGCWNEFATDRDRVALELYLPEFLHGHLL